MRSIDRNGDESICSGMLLPRASYERQPARKTCVNRVSPIEALYITTPELEAIRCDMSVMPANIVNGYTYRPELRSLLTHRTSDGRTLHLALGVDNLRHR